jgi:hypothetical protein
VTADILARLKVRPFEIMAGLDSDEVSRFVEVWPMLSG